jgi:hypothetical protein
MGVRKEVTVQHGFSQEEIAEAVRSTLLSLWGYEERSPGGFESDIGTTWQSWGERFKVDITREGIIKAVSESKVPTTLFDFGKNRENLKSFLNRLRYTFSSSGFAESKPEAYSSFMSNESTHVRSSSPGENILSMFLLFFLILIIMLILAGGAALVVLALLFFIVLLLAP